MRISEFDYTLPREAIAQSPLEPRDNAKMLVVHPNTGVIEHRLFYELPNYLEEGDLLILNDTRVTALRLYGRKTTGGKVEVLLLRETGDGLFESIVRPAKRLQLGTCIEFSNGIRATVHSILDDGMRVLQFSPPVSYEELKSFGKVPLPPYVFFDLEDSERYQTIYSRKPGSAAAPTAGLHFTPRVLEALEEKGVQQATITLDIGIDTFRPVRTDDVCDHKMHGERYEIPEETSRKIENCRGRIFAVGTTSVRAVESAAIKKRKIKSGEGVTELMITPGYSFKIVDGLITNFHMPRTTMLLLVAAFCGKELLMKAYHEALRLEYRFLSFGDSMLILPKNNI
ncbi:MAG TPA: tRNA preQ1(34) S-adenosylmethionine ribosyltransferase-isomerase QueA [Fimbriimonadales bacterium]|nr:tRNA preQ1(34) S-adenosylmethionine ribosyltransferase-isomerase QueA [Fimbriimonadales bacterium]